MKAHPVAEIFPLMTPAELRQLADDIREHGLVEPITVHKGKILDGRNRFAACKLARVKPRTAEWRGKGSPIAFVLSCNLQRRHLTPTQRAMVAAKAEALFVQEAHERRRAAGRSAAPGRPAHTLKNPRLRGGKNSTSLDPRTGTTRGKARDQAAKAVGVNPHYVTDAKRLQRDCPIVAKLAESGLVNLTQAKQLSRLAPTEQREAGKRLRKGEEPRKVLGAIRLERKRNIADAVRARPSALPTGRYSVIVTDPPWRYDQSAETATTRIRGLVDYADMSVQEICALPVDKRAEQDAVLWLWTTNAFMRHAYSCIDAWGFVEKTILTWDKELLGTGRYLRNVTEHCILAVRGKPLIDLRAQTTIIREKRRKPGQKPEAFYALVNALCPGTKLEMFSRRNRKGYTAWGGETGKLDG